MTKKIGDITKKSGSDYLGVELDGHVYFVEKKPGKRKKRTELPGKLVLQLVVRAIEEGVKIAVKNRSWK